MNLPREVEEVPPFSPNGPGLSGRLFYLTHQINSTRMNNRHQVVATDGFMQKEVGKDCRGDRHQVGKDPGATGADCLRRDPKQKCREGSKRPIYTRLKNPAVDIPGTG